MPPAADTQVALLEVPLTVATPNRHPSINTGFFLTDATIRDGRRAFATIGWNGEVVRLAVKYGDDLKLEVDLLELGAAAFLAAEAHLKAEALNDGEGAE